MWIDLTHRDPPKILCCTFLHFSTLLHVFARFALFLKIQSFLPKFHQFSKILLTEHEKRRAKINITDESEVISRTSYSTNENLHLRRMTQVVKEKLEAVRERDGGNILREKFRSVFEEQNEGLQLLLKIDRVKFQPT